MFNSKYVKEHQESGVFKAFASKVFMMDENVGTLDKCRWKLESLFEEKFKPDRDFLDYLLKKRGRTQEQIFEKGKQESPDKQV